jgi:hypothetical protein
MAALPPADADRAYQQRFAPHGLPVGPGLRAPWRRSKGRSTRSRLTPVITGWTLTFHMFDYNLDHLGPGTIDDCAWKILTTPEAPGQARRLPAAAACGATTVPEPPGRRPTPTPTATLDGDKRYTITFPPGTLPWTPSGP